MISFTLVKRVSHQRGKKENEACYENDRHRVLFQNNFCRNAPLSTFDAIYVLTTNVGGIKGTDLGGGDQTWYICNFVF
jgi:hypothetical protein